MHKYEKLRIKELKVGYKMKKYFIREKYEKIMLCRHRAGWKSAVLCMAVAAQTLTSAVPACAATVIMGGDEVEDTGISDTQGTTIYQPDSEKISEEAEENWTADGNSVSAERLSDNTIEYDELGTFIHKYNRTVQNAKTSINSTKNQYKKLREELSGELQDSVREAKDAKSGGDSDAYSTYKSYINTYKSAVKSYNKVIDNLNSYGTNQSLASIEKSLTKAAQSLMISYNTLKLTEECLKKTAEVSEAAYNNTVLMQAAGSATATDTETAKAQKDSAVNSLEQISAGKTEVYKNLCIMLGVDENAGYAIAELPEPDITYITSTDREADIQNAVNNSSAVKNLRHQSTGSSISESLKEASLTETENEVRIEAKKLYSEMEEAAKAYDAAELTGENAEESWSLAGKKNSMGMLSRAEYLSAELSYLSGKAEYENARIGLLSAINEYKWYVEGVS